MKRAEILASVIVLASGLPFVYAFSIAAVDGVERARETPVRALVGSEAYDALVSGERTDEHYVGNDRLAPDFTLRDKEGRPWRLSDHRDQVVVMNFWTIDCAPCVEELPTLDALAKLFKGRDDVSVVAISTDAGWSAVSSVVPPGAALQILFDPTKAIVQGKYGTRLYPETWILDPEGVVRLRIDGQRDWSNPLALDVIESYL